MRTQFFDFGKTAGGVLAMAGLAISISSVTHAADTTTIQGTPATSVKATYYYGFQSWATDTAQRPVVYSIKNKPAWLQFDTRYGHLYGTAPVSAIGTYSNIVISASDGVSTASLPAFSIQVTSSTGASGGGTPTGGSPTGAATLTWRPPTQNTNGSTLSGLAGYKINYGTSASQLTHTVQLANPGLTSYVVENLAPGTYFFGIEAYTGSSTSAMSSVVSKTVK
jgi:hypothetical protein